MKSSQIDCIFVNTYFVSQVAWIQNLFDGQYLYNELEDLQIEIQYYSIRFLVVEWTPETQLALGVNGMNIQWKSP